MAEKEYVERETLVGDFQERFNWLHKASEKPVGGGKVLIDTEVQMGAIIAKEFLDKAKAAPAADVVEVVRCKDCIFSETITDPIAGQEFRLCEYGVHTQSVSHTHFCGYGAKMDGKGEGNE